MKASSAYEEAEKGFLIMRINYFIFNKKTFWYHAEIF